MKSESDSICNYNLESSSAIFPIESFSLSTSINFNDLVPLSPSGLVGIAFDPPITNQPTDFSTQDLPQYSFPNYGHDSSLESSPSHSMHDNEYAHHSPDNDSSSSSPPISSSIPFESLHQTKCSLKSKKGLKGNTRVTLARQILLTISSKDFEAFIENAIGMAPLTSTEKQEVSLQRRMIKNREYASSRRREKKSCDEELRTTIDRLMRENQQLRSENAQLRTENLYLSQTQTTQMAQITQISPGSGFDSSSCEELSPAMGFEDFLRDSESSEDGWGFPAPSFLSLDPPKASTFKAVTNASYFLIFFLFFGLMIGWMSPYGSLDATSPIQSRFTTGRVLLSDAPTVWERFSLAGVPCDYSSLSRWAQRLLSGAAWEQHADGPVVSPPRSFQFNQSSKTFVNARKLTRTHRRDCPPDTLRAVLFQICLC
eukprot:TRINITY_DN11610_c0_g1_i1.p1 TRINITY_DN11610_c0_g1~~TRINITY_DN11610_c0_g1_i1.p1  ORF type:complete len:428 (+),score=87.23 TRINITY_DN11610_c0_g1_i1:1-1284(+)